MSYEPKAVNQLQIIVSADNEYYHATFQERDSITLQAYLDAFARALNVAGFTYVIGLELVTNEVNE